MLRIDETSKTLVAPPAGGLVTEVSPERDELLTLVHLTEYANRRIAFGAPIIDNPFAR